MTKETFRFSLYFTRICEGKRKKKRNLTVQHRQQRMIHLLH